MVYDSYNKQTIIVYVMGNSKTSIAKGVIALPGMVVVIIPAIILLLFDYRMFNLYQDFMFAVGIIPLTIGIYLAATTTKMFFVIGKGTPAPWDPPARIVTTGIYGRMRNPMITGAILIILGESIMLDSFALLIWALIFFVGNHFYFILSEEPALEKRFGKEYTKYKKEVPRWIPRIRR